jgi:hypothetical protein
MNEHLDVSGARDLNGDASAKKEPELITRRVAARNAVMATVVSVAPWLLPKSSEAQEAPHPLVARSKELTGAVLRTQVKALGAETTTVAACESADALVQAKKEDVQTVVEYLAKAYEQSKFPWVLSGALQAVFLITGRMKKSNPDKKIPADMKDVIAQVREHLDSGKRIDCDPEKINKYDSYKGALQAALAPIASSLIGVVATGTESKKPEERTEARKAADALLRLLEAAK